jgi:hypothetical protein
MNGVAPAGSGRVISKNATDSLTALRYLVKTGAGELSASLVGEFQCFTELVQQVIGGLRGEAEILHEGLLIHTVSRIGKRLRERANLDARKLKKSVLFGDYDDLHVGVKRLTGFGKRLHAKNTALKIKNQVARASKN